MTRLTDIKKQIMADPANQVYTQKGWEPVFIAPPTAKILIAGQAPGRKAQETLTTFNDPSGDRLRDWLGVDREAFYHSGDFAIVPMDYYYPGKGKHGDIPPRKAFAKKWNPLVLDTMPDIELKVVIGTYAQKFYLADDYKKNLTETVRHYTDYLPEYFPIVHPSPLNMRWLKKNPWFEAEVVPALQEKVQEIITQ